MKLLIKADKKNAPYIFLLPFLLFFLIFSLGPIIWSLFISFTSWNGMGEMKFVGFNNYIDILKNSRFWTATYNTLFFVLIYNLIMISLAITLAVILDKKLLRGKKFYRSAYFIPIAMSLPIVAIVFDLILAKDSGLLSILLNHIGISMDIRWFSNPSYSMWAIIMMRVWRGAGYYCAYFLAGLSSIPEEVYEAADVDGASGLQTFFKITLPLLRPMLVFVAVMSIILSFQLFDEPWILTQGGPADATLTLQIFLYQTSFVEGHLGKGSAISYLMTLLMMGASMFNAKRLSGEEK